jgi:hypothetical protein
MLLLDTGQGAEHIFGGGFFYPGAEVAVEFLRLYLLGNSPLQYLFNRNSTGLSLFSLRAADTVCRAFDFRQRFYPCVSAHSGGRFSSRKVVPWVSLHSTACKHFHLEVWVSARPVFHRLPPHP